MVLIVRAATLVGLLALAAPAASQTPELAARSRAGSAAMKEGRFDEAARIYTELVEALPDDPGLLLNLGMALAMAGRDADAIAPLERAVARDPKLLPAQLFLGSSHLARGDFANAIPPLERVITLEPQNLDGRRMLAQAYIGAGHPEKAVAALRKMTELAPNEPAAWYALGHAYNALTQHAMGTFAGEPPDSPWRQLLVADALAADGRLTDAFALYREVLERLPGMASIHDSIARIYEQTSHPDWAVEERRRGALSAAACAKRKAMCEFRAGRHRAALTAALAGSDPESRYWRTRAANELALAAFARLDKLPDSRERREVRGALARAERRYVDAIEEFAAALKLAPGDPGLLDDLGTSYYFARDYAKAVATLEPLVKRSPNDARLLTVYGDSLLQLQRAEEAIPVLRRAMEADPSNPLPATTLARAYVLQGRFAEAIPLLEARLADDRDGSLHVQLARAYQGVGQPEKAAALLERSQELQRSAQERADEIAERAIAPPR